MITLIIFYWLWSASVGDAHILAAQMSDTQTAFFVLIGIVSDLNFIASRR